MAIFPALQKLTHMCFLRNTDSYLPSATLQCVHKNMLQILETKTLPLLSNNSSLVNFFCWIYFS